MPITLKNLNKIHVIVANLDKIETNGFIKDNKIVLTFLKEIDDNYCAVNYVSDRQHNLKVQTMFEYKKILPLRLMLIIASVKRPRRIVVRINQSGRNHPH